MSRRKMTLSGKRDRTHRAKAGEAMGEFLGWGDRCNATPQPLLAAVEDDLIRLGIEHVVVVGGLEKADVLFDEIQVAAKDWMHGVARARNRGGADEESGGQECRPDYRH